jgi:hypothetical protein
MNYEQEFIDACNKSTDINEHLPRLAELASECNHITELGVGWAQSTRAFLRHGAELHSYEFDPLPGVMEFFVNARKGGRDVKFHVADTRKVVIQETDFLFVDSLHVYEQVKEELRIHADKAKKYIGFHDTTSFEFNGEFGGKGIWPAIQEFIDSHPEWKMIERRYNNNGLTILQRV